MAYACIVAGRYQVGTIGFCPLREMSEFDAAIAQDIRIRRHPSRVIRNHLLDDFFFIFLREVYLAERDAERGRNAHRIKPVCRPRALDEFRLPYLYERADDVVPLIL